MGLKQKLNEYIRNNLDSKIIRSNITHACLETPCIVAIGSAGLPGALMGPIVISAIVYPRAELARRPAKLMPTTNHINNKLNRSKRLRLFNECRHCMPKLGFMIKIISPNNLSNAMDFDRHSNKEAMCKINHVDETASLLDKLSKTGVRFDRVIYKVDYTKADQRIKAAAPRAIRWVFIDKHGLQAEPLAKVAYLAARVIFERTMKKWKLNEALSASELGGGYVGDPKVHTFLARTAEPIFGFPSAIRFGVYVNNLLADETRFAKVHWLERRSIRAISKNESTKYSDHQIVYFGERRLTRTASSW